MYVQKNKNTYKKDGEQTMIVKKVLGIEFGSTRIKAVLIDETFKEIVSGSFSWENQYENGIWTYDENIIWKGLQNCYADLAAAYTKKTGEILKEIDAIGFSGMMHGYLPFDQDGTLLVPFRTWRNTITEEASKILTDEFQYNIPQRWSIAHLYQAILNDEPHVVDIAYLTTLSGYVHWKLTGKKVLGVGEASGMFPINMRTGTYDTNMVQKFNELIKEKNYPWSLEQILPEVMYAGTKAGYLTEEGAKLLDVSGNLKAGSLLCPPEGDAGTGMVATNAVKPCTGNVSAGTSIFAMLVLEKELKRVYPEIDVVMTPAGLPVAMVHCNNCTSELNAWFSIFKELLSALDIEKADEELYPLILKKALEGEADCGGVLCCNYHSGEPIVQLGEGIPFIIHSQESGFNLANFMRAQLYATVATLKIGFEILAKEEIRIEYLMGHGGLFKTPEVGRSILANALNVDVCTMEHAGEGGAWGIALLAAYTLEFTNKKSLSEFLDSIVFKNVVLEKYSANVNLQKEFTIYMKKYEKLLCIEKKAVEVLK